MNDGSNPSPASPAVTPSELDDANLASPPSPTDITDSKQSQNDQIGMGRRSKSDKKAAFWVEKPPTLLTLPRDVLLLILKEVTHTNDLAALALTNSTLYSLAIPHIYGRFDIVWPESQSQNDDNKQGVDALTYGLATLCHGSSFARRIQKAARPCDVNSKGKDRLKLASPNYAQYTRKFSLGNGPNDWVADYMITKESGKMLGTLVAIAISKMINLETFVWDMPTGVLSDIFMSLSSLGDQPDNGCKLERVWVRWHDNDPSGSNGGAGATTQPQQAVVPVGSSLTPIGIVLPTTASHPPPAAPISYIDCNVEYPTFSVLPPLKSLAVLDIDELFYLDEMASLIKRSHHKLKELRVGIAAKAGAKDFVQTWDGPGLQQVDHKASWPGASTIGERRLGGVLGVLLGYIYDIRRKTTSKGKGKGTTSEAGPSDAQAQEHQQNGQDPGAGIVQGGGNTQQVAAEDSTGSGNLNSSTNGTNGAHNHSDTAASPGSSAEAVAAGDLIKSPKPAKKTETRGSKPERERLDGKLRLTTLELERVPLSIQVCSKAFDWTTLTCLTILDCNQHEALWKLLRRQFQPTPATSMLGLTTSKNAPLQYHLKLKQIHTDLASASLLAFLKETLEPNSLEILFLQDRRRAHPPPVDIDAIYKGPIRRHRASLRKLLIDSSEKRGLPSTDSIRWRNWVLKTEVVNFITSGRMPKLRELSVSLEYKDWHTFLQRLPNAPQLRSIHIPYIADHMVTDIEPKELASQILDIITLRPEIQLCYAGIFNKCFEFLEVRRTESSRNNPSGAVPTGGPSNNGMNGTAHSDSDVEGGENDDVDDDDVETDEEEEDDDDSAESDEDDINVPSTPTDADGSDGEDSDSDDESDFLENGIGGVKFRLREILFYEDKVGVFRARHARL